MKNIQSKKKILYPVINDLFYDIDRDYTLKKKCYKTQIWWVIIREII